jgi:hypothetical protein
MREISASKPFFTTRRTWNFVLRLVFGLGSICLLSPALSQTFYRTVEQQGVWWFAKPDGGTLFSLGVDCVDRGAAKEKYRADRPEYAAFRCYPDDDAWAKDAFARLRAWQFNTLGGWCDLDTLKAVPGETMPYTLVLHLGAYFHAPWCDLFSDDIAHQFDATARKLVTPYKDDSRLIGYFSDNELGWWDDTLFLFFLGQPPRNATRQVLMRLLRERCRQDFALLKRDFNPHGARSFADLERKANLTLRPDGQGAGVVKQFVYLLARRYYQLAHDSIRRYDTHHLLLGDRYAQYCPLEVTRAAKRYVDVVSTNYGADWPDGGISRFYLAMLHRATGRPVLITEFYMCAKENRSGNKNSSGGFPVVATQQERADSVRNNVTAFASTPYVLGAHWFQYTDEPMNGRGDGENYNMGLVDIENRPYELLTSAFADLPIETLHRESRAAVPSPAGVPPAPANPLAGLQGWDRARAYVPDRSDAPFADLYACWDAKHLYLAVFAEEYADGKLYPGGKIPPGERMTWTVSVGGSRRPVRVRFGPGGAATVEGKAAAFRAVNGGTRYTALIALSPAQCGLSAFRPGSAASLRASLASHGRAEQMAWNTTLRLAAPPRAAETTAPIAAQSATGRPPRRAGDRERERE